MIVVTGATGNVGRPLVELLASAGEKVTAVSRRPAEGLPAGVAHRRGDLADVDGLEGVFEGAEAVYLLVAGLGDELRPRAIVAAAVAAGVRRIVLQSSQLVGTRVDSASHAILRAFEEAVRESGLDWTVLRPGGFASNAFFWADQVRSGRAVAAPFADVPLPLVDPADIAGVAAEALRGPGHEGRTYVLTGPVAVSPREQVRALAGALGEPVEFVPLSAAEARSRLTRFLPAEAVDGMLSVMGEPSAEEQRVSPDVERVLGRGPSPFSAWAERNAPAFA
ncbi:MULTISPECIES: NAD(P)H-binding protein [unclassified Streptomyces]|uniref:NAD(P)H-binding protein n=1 Tax=unclassified Streptomyces TaxID=2593676 RepID=UPI0006F43B73|nr:MULTISPECIES: NAD(P)H-binding protein [unclassified Streptomyces]KQX46176.1 NmrA family transcriptional regulator [Streptomyces sp. Root1304]KRA80961.1 NmrA family transcriptional regulator [Streptomyces sp. Root66D1]